MAVSSDCRRPAATVLRSDRCPWAASYDWLRWRVFARTLESDHVTLSRDTGGNLLVAPSRNALVTASASTPGPTIRRL